MSNNDIISIPMTSLEQFPETNESTNSQNKMTTFGKNIKKYIPNKSAISTPNDQIQDNKKEQDKIHKSLQKMSIKQGKKKNLNPLLRVAYPVLNGTKILVASIPKGPLFNFSIAAHEAVIVGSKIKIPSNKFTSEVVNYLLKIPENTHELENKVKQKTYGIYNYFRENSGGIDKEKMNIGSNSIIYTNGDIYELSLILMDLTSNWSDSLCVCSKEDLMTINKLKDFKKNNNLEAMLDSYVLNDSYNFSIFANSVMPSLKTTIYLNFFNISPNDLEKVDIQNIKMIDIKKV